MAAAAAAIVWANSPWSDSYFDFWHTKVSFDLHIFALSEDLQHLVNDGLMAIFFFVVGLEIKRELLHGELSQRQEGVTARAGCGWRHGRAGARLSGVQQFRRRRRWLGHPHGDGHRVRDRGAGAIGAPDSGGAASVLAGVGGGRSTIWGQIAVIAVFYTDTIDWSSLGISLAILGAAALSVRVGIRSMVYYIAAGVAMWYFFLESGVHATLAGVLLAVIVPAGSARGRDEYATALDDLLHDYRLAMSNGDEEHADIVLEEIEQVSRKTEAPLESLEHMIHPWVSLAILPLFALANAGVVITSETLSDAAGSSITIGIVAGLLAGKAIGIFGITWLAIRSGIGQLPASVTLMHVLGVGFLAGIGFTVAIFISGIAFDDPALVDQAKMGIFVASIAAAIIGYALLRFSGKRDAQAAS